MAIKKRGCRREVKLRQKRRGRKEGSIAVICYRFGNSVLRKETRAMRAQFVTGRGASERKMASSKRSCLYILLLCYNVLQTASTTQYSVPSKAT